ncbi:MAG: hypothetical protein WEA61_00190 [Anaerolineales bacterium]
MAPFRQKSFGPRLTSLISSVLICSLLLAAMPAGLAFAGDCDGTAGDDNITCSADPTVPDGDVGLGLGDDVYVQNELVVSQSVQGDALEDGADNFGDGGNDNITVNGFAFAVTGDGTDGNGGADTIILGSDSAAFGVLGDSVTGNGGDDTIVFNGAALFVGGDGADGDGGSDTIIINGETEDVAGDEVLGKGGDDLIIINGFVLFDVTGDCADGDGGNDTIVVNGEVGGDVLGDCVGGAGGDDTVTLGAGAIVGGIIDGEDGFDTLQFAALTQGQLAGLDPAGGTITFGGNTYAWLNFEQLIGLLRAAGLRILYDSNNLVAVDQTDGIAVFAEHGRIAFISYSSLAALSVGGSQSFSTPNSAGWYVAVTNLGANPTNPSNDLFQVTIFDAAGGQQGQFTFGN